MAVDTESDDVCITFSAVAVVVVVKGLMWVKKTLLCFYNIHVDTKKYHCILKLENKWELSIQVYKKQDF